MIDKQEFYHGAAIIRLLEDERCQKVQKHSLGYTVNDETFINNVKNHALWAWSEFKGFASKTTHCYNLS